MKSFEVRRVADEFDEKRLREFMLGQPQYYPNYGEWVDGKCLPRIEEGRAHGWMAVVDGRVAGNAVLQTLHTPGTIEIKNLRIDPTYRRRDIGHFLLRQVEVEGAIATGAAPGELTIVTDVSTPNFSGVEFFVRNGYHIEDMRELYQPGQAEYLLKKMV